jgi:hypothetical protein
MAFWESRLFNLNEIAQPKKIMNHESLNNGINYIEKQKRTLLEEYSNPDASANDFKDYLYWRHREARLLQSMAYFRKCYIPHFTPFLFNRTLAVIKRTPSKYRIQKKLFVAMGKKMFPELFLDNKAISVLPSDVNNFSLLYKNDRFRSFIKDALLDGCPRVFKDVFEKKQFEPWVYAVLNGGDRSTAVLQKKYDIKRHAVGLLSKSGYVKSVIKAKMVNKGANTFPILDVNYLFRLVVLSLALNQHKGSPLIK